MSEWVEILRGLPGEVTVAQSWLQANGIPTFLRDADPYTGMKALLVPSRQMAKAKDLLVSLLGTMTPEEGEEHEAEAMEHHE